jgi:ribose 5-phosphate isomerase RpiB
MAGQQRDIEWIVGEVMRRLMDVRAAGEKAEAEQPPARKPSNESGHLRLSQRVVTTALVEGRLDGVRQVVVPARAVVTPAVRDALRKKRITIVSQSETCDAEPGSDTCIVGVVDPAGQFGSATAAVSAELGDVRRLDSDCVVKAIRGVVGEVETGQGAGIVFTGQPSVALCLANRQPGIRAAWAVNAAAVQEAEQSIGANLLVINPASHGMYELRAMIREFARGTHACPKQYRKALDG